MDSAATAGLRATRRAAASAARSDVAAVQSAALAGWATWLTVAWTAAGTMFYLLTPKIGPVIVALSVVAPLLWLGSETRHLRPFHASSLAIVLGMSALYLLINSSWSLARPDAYRSVLTFIMAVAVLFIVVAAHRALHEQALRAMLLGFLAGYIAGGTLLCLLCVDDYAVLIAVDECHTRMAVRGGVGHGARRQCRRVAGAILEPPCGRTGPAALACGARRRHAVRQRQDAHDPAAGAGSCRSGNPALQPCHLAGCSDWRRAPCSCCIATRRGSASAR